MNSMNTETNATVGDTQERGTTAGEGQNSAESYPLKVAVVGAGPAGVYTADILLRQLKQSGARLGLPSEASIDLFEKLPVPFGLVRYGVAPDHPAIKYIMGALEKTLNNPHIHLYADVEFGKDLSLEDVTDRYDAVIFATGAVDDRPLTLKGHDLHGVYGAARFVEWYDGYPDASRSWPLEAEQVAVIGGGNVAMDVSRLLVRYPEDLLGTDIPDNVYHGLEGNKAREVHVFVRRGVAQAKFSVQELRELEKLPGVRIVTDDNDFNMDEETLEVAAQDKLTRQMVEELFAVHDLSLDMEDAGGLDFQGQKARRTFYLHFNSNPVEIVGQDGKVTALRVQRTKTSPQGQMTTTDDVTEYPVQAVYHAIGYKPAQVAGIPYNDARYTLTNVGGRIYSAPEDQGGHPLPYVYASGWAKRGPVGLIGSTKSDALETVGKILEDWAQSGTGGHVAPHGSDTIDDLLAERGLSPLDYQAWKRIDAYERSQGAAVGREHIKVIDSDQLRAIGRQEYQGQ